uniref:SHR-BD domain-containing protein n=1 Tax=Macrostomum lignano TaxID=282301 RepID=A0A1I8IQM7_9PLAT
DASTLNAASIAAAAAAAAVAGKCRHCCAAFAATGPSRLGSLASTVSMGNGSGCATALAKTASASTLPVFRRSSNGSSNGDSSWHLRGPEDPAGLQVPSSLPRPGRPLRLSRAARLLSIGAGYGKRLTFDVKSLSSGEGANRRPVDHYLVRQLAGGYALSLSALDVGQRFALQTRSGQEIGRAEVTWTAPEPADGFPGQRRPDACLRCLLGCHDYEDVAMTGIASTGAGLPAPGRWPRWPELTEFGCRACPICVW